MPASKFEWILTFVSLGYLVGAAAFGGMLMALGLKEAIRCGRMSPKLERTILWINFLVFSGALVFAVPFWIVAANLQLGKGHGYSSYMLVGGVVLFVLWLFPLLWVKRRLEGAGEAKG